MANELKLLSVNDTAKILRCSPPTVRKLIETGSLQAIKTNKGEIRAHWGILESSVNDWQARSSRRKALRDATFNAAKQLTPVQGEMFSNERVIILLDKLVVEAKKQTELLQGIGGQGEAIVNFTEFMRRNNGD